MTEDAAPLEVAVLLRAAAECRAAARRVRVAVFEGNPAWALYDEAGRHEEVAATVKLRPAVTISKSLDGSLGFCARFHSPLGTAEYWGRMSGPRRHPFVTCSTHAAYESGDEVIGPRRKPLVHERPLGGHFTLGRQVQPGSGPTSPLKPSQISKSDVDVAIALVEGALLSMADTLDHEVHARRVVGDTPQAELSSDALDTLELLLKLKAVDQERAVSVKVVAPHKMRRRKDRKMPSTYVKAAERGAAELKAAGLVVARPRLGTWLSVAGSELARQRFPGGSDQNSSKPG